MPTDPPDPEYEPECEPEYEPECEPEYEPEYEPYTRIEIQTEAQRLLIKIFWKSPEGALPVRSIALEWGLVKSLFSQGTLLENIFHELDKDASDGLIPVGVARKAKLDCAKTFDIFTTIAHAAPGTHEVVSFPETAEAPLARLGAEVAMCADPLQKLRLEAVLDSLKKLQPVASTT